MEKFNGWEFCKAGSDYVESLHITNDAPIALYGYDGAKTPSAFESYKNLLKAVGSKETDLELVEDWTYKEGHSIFGGREFVRKSTDKQVYNEDLMRAAVEDDLKIVGMGMLRMMARSREPHRNVYIFTYEYPAVWDVQDGRRSYEDGKIRVSVSGHHTNKFGGRYDEAFAYKELNQIVKYYSVKQKTYSAVKRKEAVSNIGKGENSGVNFRPIRKN